MRRLILSIAVLLSLATGARAQTTWTPPTIPKHYSHIRVCLIGYGGQFTTTFGEGLLRNSLDMVDAGSPFTSAMGAIKVANAPNTPMCTYTNISNIYLDLLMDWRNYADAHGLNPEGGMLHVSAPAVAAATGGGSTLPCYDLWACYQGTATLTDATVLTDKTAATGSPFTQASTTFGTAGTAIYCGMPDRFDTLVFNLASGAAAGYTVVAEYPTAVDAQGVPTAWATMPTAVDGTAGLTQSGTWTFNPNLPLSGWVAASLNAGSTTFAAGAKLYYVRLRTTVTGTAPGATTIRGVDFLGSTGGGFVGTIPAFDSTADADGDGYLNPAEWAGHDFNRLAHFKWQSRAFTTYGAMRYGTFPSDTGFRSWVLDFSARRITNGAGGLFVDNSGNAWQAPANSGVAGCTNTINPTITTSLAHGLLIGSWVKISNIFSGSTGINGRWQVASVPSATTFTITLATPPGAFVSGFGHCVADTIEDQSTWDTNYGTLLAATAAAVSPNVVFANGGTNPSADDAIIAAYPFYMYEFGVRPFQSLVFVQSFMDQFTTRAALASPQTYAVLDSSPAGGSQTDPRTQMSALAYYHLLSDPTSTFFMAWGGQDPPGDWQTFGHWWDGIAYDIGQPTETFNRNNAGSKFAAGTDPWSNTAGNTTGFTYKYIVYQRHFTNALVLYRPISNPDSPNQFAAAAPSDNTTAVTFTLPGTYKLLNSDATFATPSTQVTLRGGEGAILVPASALPSGKSINRDGKIFGPGRTFGKGKTFKMLRRAA